jgi:hypothetical protein
MVKLVMQHFYKLLQLVILVSRVNSLPLHGSTRITVALEERICVASHCQILTMVDKHIISRSPKIVEYSLITTQCGNPGFD